MMEFVSQLDVPGYPATCEEAVDAEVEDLMFIVACGTKSLKCFVDISNGVANSEYKDECVDCALCRGAPEDEWFDFDLSSDELDPATPEPTPIEDTPCSTGIMPGVIAPSHGFVVGVAQAGTAAPGDGFECSAEGCREISDGEMAPSNSVFLAHYAEGARFPDGARGLLGCSIPQSSQCVAVHADMVAPESGLLVALVGPGATTVQDGVWFDLNQDSDFAMQAMP